MQIVKTTVGFRGPAGAGMTAADREELDSMRQGLAGSLALIAALTSRVGDLEAGGGPVIPVEPSFTRQPTGPNDNLAVDGHSLTNTMEWSGPYPSNFRAIRNSALTDYPEAWAGEGQDGNWYVLHSSIPGSTMDWRRGYEIVDGARTFTGNHLSLAWQNLDKLNEITFTEAGPVFLLGHAPHEAMRKATLTAFVDAIMTGCDAGIYRFNIWSIWPQLDGWVGHTDWDSSWGQLGGFRPVLLEYGRSFKYLVDYLNWKIPQLRTDLPSGWKVHYFPGHLFMLALNDGMQAGTVPGFSDFNEIWHPDDPALGKIHPAHPVAYGFAAFGVTLHYQVNLATKSGVYVAPAWHENTPGGGSYDWPATDPAYAAWAYAKSWEIATSFAPAGMGGTQGVALEFDGAVDADPLEAGGGPVDPGTDTVPADFVLDLSATGYTGPALTGTMPAVNGNHLSLTGAVQKGDLALSGGFYAVMLFRLGSGQMSGPGDFFMVSPNLSSWQKPMAYARLTPHVDGPQIHVMSEIEGAPWPEGLDLGKEPYGQWAIYQGWIDGDAFGGRRGMNAEVSGSNPSGPVTATAQIQLFENVICDLGHLRIYNRLPTEEERGGITAWAQARAIELS